MKCPHCRKKDCVRTVVYKNVRNYGSNTFDLPCVNCGKMIYVEVSRKVNIDFIGTSKRKISESDF